MFFSVSCEYQILQAVFVIIPKFPSYLHTSSMIFFVVFWPKKTLSGSFRFYTFGGANFSNIDSIGQDKVMKYSESKEHKSLKFT